MKKVKIFIVGLISIFIIFMSYIEIELSRFNNNLGSNPLIIIGEINTYITANNEVTKKCQE